MAYQTIITEERRPVSRRELVMRRQGPAFEAYSLLYFVYIVAPIVAGLDKFFHYLVDWNIYVSPTYAAVAGGNVGLLMQAVGVIEIIAGLIVATKPSVGGYIVCLWLWGIIADLLLIPGYFDVALRDFGLSLGALALARLAREFGR